MGRPSRDQGFTQGKGMVAASVPPPDTPFPYPTLSNYAPDRYLARASRWRKLRVSWRPPSQGVQAHRKPVLPLINQPCPTEGFHFSVARPLLTSDDASEHSLGGQTMLT